jgi:UDP-glucose 4-epimerase
VNKEDQKIFGEVLNVGTGTNVSVNELADLVGGKKIYVPQRPGEARETLADNSKIRQMLGWKPTLSIGDWIKKTMS